MKTLQWTDWARWHGLEKADLVELREDVKYHVQRIFRDRAFVDTFITYLESLRFEEFNEQLTKPHRPVPTGLAMLDDLIADLKRMLVEKS